MKRQQVLLSTIAMILVIMSSLGCGGNVSTVVVKAPTGASAPEHITITSSPMPPTPTPVVPTETPTPVPPTVTSTPVPPTATQIPPTAMPTPVPPTATPTSIPPTVTLTPELPTATPAPMPMPEIKTSESNLVITDVQLADRFPPDCNNPPSPGCDKVKEGYQILIVWLERTDGGDPFALSPTKFLNLDIYVTAADDSRTNIALSGISQSRLFVAFTPPVSAQGFKLVWPDNPPIELGK